MRKRRKSPPFRVAKAPRRRIVVDVNDDEFPVPGWRRFVPAEDEDDEEESPPPRRRRCKYDFDDDDEEDYRDLDFELLQALCHVENYSYSLERGRANVARLIRNNPPLAVKWKEFTSQGGIDAKDFENFLSGKLRTRLTRGKKHLRLVSSRNPPPIRLRRSQNDDPDEVA